MSTETQTQSADSKGVLPGLVQKCNEENGWVDIDPPTEEQQREAPSIIGNWNGKPIKTGFLIEDRTEESGEGVLSYKVYRTSKYNIHFRVKEVKYPEETEYNHEGHTGTDGTLTLTVPEQSDAAGEMNIIAQKATTEGQLRGAYTTDGSLDPEKGVLDVEVEGEIEPGNEVEVTVRDEEGNTVAGADIYQEGPAKLATGQVFVREVEGYK